MAQVHLAASGRGSQLSPQPKSSNRIDLGKSLAAQWLGLPALTAEGPGSVPGWGIPQAAQRDQTPPLNRIDLDWRPSFADGAELLL